MADLIPDHLLIHILIKLPVKTLLKCTCVSKSWNSLIRSPFFITTHFNTAQKSHLLVKCFSRIELKWWYSLFQPHNILQPAKILEFPFASRSTRVPFEVVGSVRGLICLRDGLDCNLIIVWNPMIRRHIRLPIPTFASSVAFVGFGFDHSTDDFKVVRLAYTGFNVDRKYKGKVEIWSLQHPVWRVLPDHKDMIGLNTTKPGSSAFFINGSIHWFVSQHLHGRLNVVLSFDVEKERFRTIGLPDELKHIDSNLMWLSKFGLSLALMYIDYQRHPCQCVILVMTEYGVEESWTEMVRTELQIGVEKNSWVREHWSNMLIATNESELSMASYDFYHEYGKVFGLQYEKGESVACVDTFVESLFLLDK